MRVVDSVVRGVAVCAAAASFITGAAAAPSTAGIEALVQRRLPNHVDSFEFSIVNETDPLSWENDEYAVSTTCDGKILVEGSSLSALATG
jgi:alpha-N-acetylglucosaminidase